VTRPTPCHSGVRRSTATQLDAFAYFEIKNGKKVQHLKLPMHQVVKCELWKTKNTINFKNRKTRQSNYSRR
jgi:hypothetical protein